MTKPIAFDMTRVEVLKGPEGMLYRQNATGGAVNYIAAKPTKAFDTGMEATYGRFNRHQVGRSAEHGLIARASASTLCQAIRGAGGANEAESAEASGDSLES